MDVNQHETKTCAVVCRCQNSRIPADVVSTYIGDAEPFKACYQCLGVVLHATKKMQVAAAALAASGSRAMHAVLGDANNNALHSLTSCAGLFSLTRQ
jgi:uncharacterized CHY-type Zn-finger protein